MLCRLFFVSVPAVALLAPALAAPVAITSFREELVRINDLGGSQTTETFTLTDQIRSMHKDSAGNVYAVGRAVAGQSPLYRLENAQSGTPSLTFLDTLGFNYSATARKGDTVFAFNNADEVWALDVSDPTNISESLIGNTGIPVAGQEIAGAAIDLENDTLFGGSSELDALYKINQATGAATLVGSFLPGDPNDNTVNSIGMDHFDGGLYATLENRLNDRRELGLVNPDTGAFSSLIDLGPRAIGSIVSIGLVVIPEPASAVLLALGLLAFARRR